MSAESGTTTDPRAGTGGFVALVEVATFAAEQLGGTQPWFLQVANDEDYYVHGFDWATEPSTQVAPQVQAHVRKEPVIFFPPLSRAEDFGVGEVLSVIPESEKSVLGLVLPSSFLSRPTASGIRESLTATWNLRLVATADSLGEGIHRDFKLSVLLFSARPGRGIAWFEIPRGGLGTHWKKQLAHMLRVPADKKDCGFVVPPDRLTASSWDARQYDPAIEAQEEALATIGPKYRLGDIAEVLNDGFRATFDREHVVIGEASAGTRLLRGRDVTRMGVAGPTEETMWVSPSHPRFQPAQLREGDLLIRSIHRADSPLVFAEVEVGDLPAIADTGTVLVVRIQPDVSPARRLLLKTYLGSPMAADLLRESDMRVRPDALRNLPIPSPDEALQAAFDELEDAASHLDSWRMNVEDVLQQAFNDRELVTARRSIIEGGRRARLRVRAALLVDDFEHTVRTQFPYPVAYKYRTVTALRATSDTRSAYDAILDCAEVLITCMGSVALALAERTEWYGSTAAAVSDQFSRGGRAIGLGTWWSVLTAVADQSIPDGSVLRDFANFARSPEVRHAYEGLSARRNAESHRRRLEPDQLAEGVAMSSGELLTLMEAAEFLVDLPLVHTIAIRTNARSGRSQVEHRVLRGDHPIVPVSHLTSEQLPLETDSLYCLEDGRELHLLGPFLITRRCPTCKSQSVFHLDRRVANGILLKSLEHGHVLEADDPAMTLELLGIDGAGAQA